MNRFNAIGAWFGRLVDLIFGFDFFISYAHADGRNYPQTLAKYLERFGYRIFLDTRGYVAGTELNTATQRRVKMSKYLVLVARPSTMTSQWVVREVKVCLSARRVPIVIDVNRTIAAQSDGEVFHLLQNRIYIPENLPTIDDDPSQGTVEKLLASFKATKQETIRMRIVAATTFIFAVIAGIAFWQYTIATDRMKLAIARQLIAQAQVIFSEDPNKQDLAVLLAAEGMLRRPSVEGDEVLRQASRLLPPPVRKIRHNTTVDKVVFSPDSSLIAFGDSEGWLSAFDIKTGRSVRRIKAADGYIGTVAFGKDGTIYTAGSDKFLKKWNIDTGKQIWNRKVDDLLSSSLAVFSADGRFLATMAADETPHLWNVETGASLPELDRRFASPFLSFSADGNFFASGGEGAESGSDRGENKMGGIVVWSTATGHRVREILADTPLMGVAISPDGSYIVGSGMDGSVRVFREDDGVEVSRMSHNSVIKDQEVSPDGRLVGTIDDWGTAHIWTGADGQEVFRRSSSDKSIFPGEFTGSVSFSREGKYFATVTLEDEAASNHSGLASRTQLRSTIWIWDADLKARAGFQHSGKSVGHPFSHDGKYVALPQSMHDDRLVIFGLDAESTVGQFSALGRISDVDFACDGKTVAIASWDGNAYVLNRSGKLLVKLKHGDRVTSARISCDGSKLITASDDKSVRLWSLPNGKLDRRLSFREFPYRAAITDDGRLAATLASVDRGDIVVFRTDSGDELQRLKDSSSIAAAHSGFEVLEFAPGGRSLATGSRNGTVLVWDVASGRIVGRASFGSEINSLAFSLDGDYLAVATYDGYARVWDIAAGDELVRMKLGSTSVGAIAFVNYDSLLMTNLDFQGPDAVSGGQVRAWPWRVPDTVAAAGRGVLRNLTQAEWQHYVGVEPYRATFANLTSGDLASPMNPAP